VARTGVTQVDVDGAADALLLSGERPTVERIRAALGRGSPNNVGRLLETWWQGVGIRLSAANARLVLPHAPEAVAKLAEQWWELALTAGRAEAEAGLRGTREQLAADVAAAAAARESERAERDAALQARQLAEGRLTDALRLAEEQATQLDELRRRHAQLERRATESEHAQSVLRERLDAQSQAATAERDGLRAHVQATEDRAHAEIDRTRQEIKRLQREAETSAKAHRTALATLQGEVTAWQAAVRRAEATSAAAERELATVRAHNAQLHDQLTQALSRPLAPRTTARSLAASVKRKAGSRASARKPGGTTR
jgi:chromosome segregation ATPase